MFDRLSLAVDHATNAFRDVSTKHWLAAVETDSSRDLLNSDGFAVDVKDLAHKFLTAHGVSACMTVKHGYLRWE